MQLISLATALSLLLVVLALRASQANRFVGYCILLVTAGISFLLFRTYVEEIYDGWTSAKAEVVDLASKAGLMPPAPHCPAPGAASARQR